MNMNIFRLLKFAEYEYEYIWYLLNWLNMNMNIFGTTKISRMRI